MYVIEAKVEQTTVQTTEHGKAAGLGEIKEGNSSRRGRSAEITLGWTGSAFGIDVFNSVTGQHPSR